MLYVLGVILSLPSQNNYWFGDDTFMVRTYSNAEIVASLSGPFEPSGASTIGYRPLTVIFDHAISLIFGENIALMRFFNIALLTAHVLILVYVAQLLGVTRKQAFLAGVLILCMKNTWFVLVWPADAVRSFMAIFGDLTLLLFLRALIKRLPLYLGAAALCFTIALFTREEILPYLVVIPATGLLFLWQQSSPLENLRERVCLTLREPSIKYVIAGTVLLIVSGGLYWLIRNAVIPNAEAVSGIEGWLFNLMLVLFPRMPFGSLVIAGISLLCLWIGLIIMIVKLPAKSRLLALFWLGCTVIASALGLVSPRANNLLLPIGFFALFLVTVLGNYARRSRAAALLVSGILVWFIAGSAIANQTAQLAITPTSTTYIEENMEMVWGKWSDLPIPDVRRDEISRQLAQFGMTSENFRLVYQQIQAAALADQRHYPTADGTPFVPLTNWLHGW